MNADIERYYGDLRSRNLTEHKRRLSEASALDEGFAKLEQAQATILSDAARGKFSYIEAAHRLQSIGEDRRSLLGANHLPSDYLDPIYSCPACHDTGWVGDTLQNPCACRLKQIHKNAASASSVNDRETFENFREDIYTSEEQRKQHSNAKIFCRRYADALPTPQPMNLLLFGTAGSGKSYLGNAMARRAIEHGVDASFLTAYRFVQEALNGIQRREGGIDRYMHVSFLVLDDLGVEPMIPNITFESLFSLINERQARRLPTVVITNLSPAALQERYGERLSSRLCDKRETAALCLEGDNLRRNG